MEEENLCVLCSCSSSRHSEASEEESSLLKSLIFQQFQLDGLSPTPKQTLLLSLCSGCTSLVSSAIKSKVEVTETEVKVEVLKRELGVELFKLRGQLEDFKTQMIKLEKVKCQMEKSNDSGGIKLQDYHEDERTPFRKSINKVIRDLHEEYGLITRKTRNFFPIFQISIEDYKQNPSIDSDMEEDDNDMVEDVKVEPESDDECDQRIPSSDETVDNRGSPRKIKGEPTEEEEEQDHLDPDLMEDSGSTSSEEDDEDKAHTPENKDDSDNQPGTSMSKLLPMKPLLKSKTTNKRKTTSDDNDPESFDESYQTFLDEVNELGISNLKSTPFKQHVIGRILLKNKKDELNSIAVSSKTDDFEIFLQNIEKTYKIEYKLAEDFLHVHGIEMKINDEEKSLNCSLCDFSTSGAKCNISITVEYILYNHIIGEHLSVFKCPRCSELSNSRSTFLQHANVHRKKEQRLEASPHICDICQKPMKAITGFRMHKWTHKSEQEKNEARTRRQQNKNKYDADSWIPVNCPTCNQDFSTNRTLKYHIELHHNHKPPNLEEILCPICGKSFAPLSFRKNHQKTCGVPKEELYVKPNRGKIHKCHLCEKTYSSKSFLKEHLNSAAHYDLKKFQCHICPESFTSNTRLNYHVAGHTQPRTECSKMCGKNFKRSQHLKLHEAKCNGPLPEKPLLSCEICSKVFKLPWKLKKHVNMVHVPKSPTELLLCSHCPKLFKSKKYLTEHLKRIERSAAGVRDHLCRKGCGAGFVLPETRLRHEKTCNGS